MRALPRSRVVPLLRTPAPFRHAAALLALAALAAVGAAQAPAVIERARLAEALIAASVLRVDPVLDLAAKGRWPDASGLDWLHEPQARGTRVEAQHVLEDGVALTIARGADRVRLELRYASTPGGTLTWRCRVRSEARGAIVDPWSLPAACRA